MIILVHTLEYCAVDIKGGIRSTAKEYFANKRVRRIKGESGWKSILVVGNQIEINDQDRSIK